MSMERQEPLQNLGVMVAEIRTTGGTGRLALRNTVRMGMLHLYFERGQLVHLEGSHGNTDEALIDLAGWSGGLIRFDREVLAERHTVTPAQQDFFQRTLLLMQQHGAVGAPPRFTSSETLPSSASGWSPSGQRPAPQRTSARVPIPQPSSQPLPEAWSSSQDDFSPSANMHWSPPKHASAAQRDRFAARLSSAPLPPVSGKTEVLLSARQWEFLVEVMRSMLDSLGRLLGQQQAQNILQHALIERSEESEVLGLLQIDRQGWLREVRMHEMVMQPVREVASAFVLLISDFERRAAALLGEEKARQMIARALYPYHDGLAEIGIALN